MCTRETCTSKFTSRQALRRHVRTHDKPKPYTCNFEGCEMAFTKKTHLRAHQLTHKDCLPFVCTHISKDSKGHSTSCTAAFRTYRELRKHRSQCHEPPRHKCNYEGCNKVFKKFVDLRAHKTSEHPEAFIFPCQICQKLCNSKAQLANHMRSHTKKHICPHEGCSKSFATSYNLKTHFNAVHMGIKPYPCSQCEKSFTTKASMQRHMAKIHSEVARVALIARKRKRIIDSIVGRSETKKESNSKDDKDAGRKNNILSLSSEVSQELVSSVEEIVTNGDLTFMEPRLEGIRYIDQQKSEIADVTRLSNFSTVHTFLSGAGSVTSVVPSVACSSLFCPPSSKDPILNSQVQTQKRRKLSTSSSPGCF